MVEMDELTESWMDGWMNGWMDGWMDGWINNSMKKLIDVSTIRAGNTECKH